jgi:hypothetical protein
MKRLITMLVATIGIGAFAADSSIQGYLVDTTCASSNSSKPGFGAEHSRTCLRMPSCADSGYGVLTGDKRFIKFDENGNEQAKKLVADLGSETGIQINVTGPVNGDHMTVAQLSLVGDAPKPQAQTTAPPPEQPQKTLPFIVKGAWASASDSVTPLPEGGSIADAVYNNQYFGLSYPFTSDWYEKTKGPPPSDSGYYVLAQIRPSDTFKGPAKGLVLIGAQDLFFSLVPGKGAMELISHTKDTLRPEFRVERQPTQVRIANHSFVRLDYVATAINLHWYVLATDIRCHVIQFSMASTDTKLLDSLVQDLNKMTLPAEAGLGSGTGGGDTPACVPDYASGDNVLTKVDPVLTDHRFNPIPVRIIIGKDGKVRHIHFISAFPDQSKAISDALMQWTFKPYLQSGKPVEVETGILFGDGPRRTAPHPTSVAMPAKPN